MKVLVIGGTGLVGSAVVNVLAGLGQDVIAPSRAVYDILDGPVPSSLLAGVDAAVNAAVVRAPAHRDAAWRINAEFPHEMAQQCSTAGVSLIHISTDGVFSGRVGPNDEAATPDPDDDYGVQKHAGEPVSALVIRTSVVGPERRGFNSLLCWFLAQQKDVPGYVDSLWNGVTSLALARCIARLLDRDTIPVGVRHIFSDDVSKHELLLRLTRSFERQVDVLPVRAPIPRDRRLCTLYPDFLAACALPTLDAQLAELPALVDARGAWRRST